MENMVAFEISFDVQPERSAMKRNNSEGFVLPRWC